jgi:hypothetical protein
MRHILVAGSLATLLIVASMSYPAFGQFESSTFLQNRIQVACTFLDNLYNPSLGLLRNTPNSTVYYVASDTKSS